MKTRKFGSTGIEISALGLGCMRMPTQRLRFMKMDVPEAIKIIRSAVDMGINYFDTAWPYHLGESEKILGQALLDGYREKVHLVTKLPMFLVNKEEDFDRYLNRQLEKLQTSHIDTYLFHSMNAGALEKLKKFNLIDKMIKAREEGKIKYIGFSFHDTLPVFKEIVDFYNWDVIQIQYNYMDTAIQAGEEGLKYAAATGAAIVIMEPVKGGKLANPPKEAVAVMSKSAVKRSAVDWALQYLWNLPEVSIVISGMGSMKMLEENVASAENSGVGSLAESELETITELTEIYRKNIVVPCTACQYCMPCPAGVNIPMNFAILNNVAIEGSKLRQFQVRRSYKKLANKKEKLDADRTNGNASLCINCGKCVPKCPQSIAIPQELLKVNAVLGNRKKLDRGADGGIV